MNKPQLSAEIRKHCMCERCKDGVIHASHCAVHNMPAEPNGECDCEPETPAFSEDLSYYWQRILGEDWTNNQPLYELYLYVVKELATALEEQRMQTEVKTGLNAFGVTMEEIAKARADERKKVLSEVEELVRKKVLPAPKYSDYEANTLHKRFTAILNQLKGSDDQPVRNA